MKFITAVRMWSIETQDSYAFYCNFTWCEGYKCTQIEDRHEKNLFSLLSGLGSCSWHLSRPNYHFVCGFFLSIKCFLLSLTDIPLNDKTENRKTTTTQETTATFLSPIILNLFNQPWPHSEVASCDMPQRPHCFCCCSSGCSTSKTFSLESRVRSVYLRKPLKLTAAPFLDHSCCPAMSLQEETCLPQWLFSSGTWADFPPWHCWPLLLKSLCNIWRRSDKHPRTVRDVRWGD